MNDRKPRVLVADDSATVRFALFALLNARYDVYLAPDGETAIEIAGDIMPHAILLDVMMPGMDGFETCRRLRADANTVMTPIIMVTSQAEEWDVEAGYASGCTDYVMKPVDRAELMTKLDSWLGAVAA